MNYDIKILFHHLGTMRKSANRNWSKWKVQDGNGLHRLQIQIAIRGMQLLKPGGLMVYSTCSFNPVEVKKKKKQTKLKKKRRRKKGRAIERLWCTATLLKWGKNN